MLRTRLQPPGRRGCWPLLRPLSAVADPGRHPGRCLSTGGLKTGSVATRFRRNSARRQRGSGVLAPPGDGTGGGGASLAGACRVDRRRHGRWRRPRGPAARRETRRARARPRPGRRRRCRCTFPARALRVAGAGGARRLRAAGRAHRTSWRGRTSDGNPHGSRGEQPAARPPRARLLLPLRRAARHENGCQAVAHRRGRRQPV